MGAPNNLALIFEYLEDPGVVQLTLSLSWVVMVSGTESVYHLCIENTVVDAH